MAKRGSTKHQKRVAVSKSVPLSDKKESKWMIKQSPGPHSRGKSMPLSVLLKVMGAAKTSKEARMLLVRRMVEVDGRIRAEEKFPVGLMDVISLPKAEKHYRIIVDWKGRLKPLEIDGNAAKSKILRVTGKHIAPGAKINLAFHDGRNMIGDNNVHPGDSVVVSLPGAKMESHLRLEKGVRCLIVEGKHAGKIVTLGEIIQRKAGKPSEARVSMGQDEFITVARYLFVIDKSFEVAG